MRIPMTEIDPLRQISTTVRNSVKYKQIAASIREVGVIEPPVVIPKPKDPRRFQLLDGHIRIEILKERGDTDVVCLIATADEAFTYNKRISRIAPIQLHRMLLKAIEKGVPEERLARALNVNMSTIKQKVHLLDGICAEVVTLLQDRQVAMRTFDALRRMRPMRQIEVAEIMISMNRFSQSYAESFLASTPTEGLVHKDNKPLYGLTTDQIARMQEESGALEREFRLMEKDYGALHLDLVIALGFLSRCAQIAAASGLDMAAKWEAPVAFYDRLKKPVILKIIAEELGQSAADNCAKMKKGELAIAAAERLAGRGWLPRPLRIGAMVSESKRGLQVALRGCGLMG
jgi:hypothetical protein